MRMAGNGCADCGKRVGSELKAAALVKAAQELARRCDGDYDLRLEVITEYAAGGEGPARQRQTWGELRRIAHEQTGVNYGHPSDGTQTAVLGTLYGMVAKRSYYRRHPEQVFAGLGVS